MSDYEGEVDRPSRVLVVDDDDDLRALIVVLLETAGYQVLEASRGREALSLAFTEQPELVLLDCEMPEMDGFEVLATLRAHLQTRHVPVLLLTARSAITDRVRGLESGADDYIVKPFADAELVARVAMALRRHHRDVAADPLTKLPGNVALRDEISRRWGASFAISYIDLDHFKAYVDNYGFENASDVIKRLGQILYNTVIEEGVVEDFVGHIGGDDFLLISDVESAEAMCRKIRDELQGLLEVFYDPAALEAGCIEGVDRYGSKRSFDLLDLSIAIIEVHGDAPRSQDLFGRFASECKKAVKNSKGEAKVRRFPYPAGRKAT